VGSPRVDVVFRLWQCDKENHGWREGPPVTVLCQVFDLLAGPSPSGLISFERKQEYCFTSLPPAPQNIGRFKTTSHSCGFVSATPSHWIYTEPRAIRFARSRPGPLSSEIAACFLRPRFAIFAGIATVQPDRHKRANPVAQLDDVYSDLRLNYETLKGLISVASLSVAKPTLCDTLGLAHPCAWLKTTASGALQPRPAPLFIYFQRLENGRRRASE